MNYNDWESWLGRVRSLNLKIANKNYEIEALYTCIGLSSINYDRVSVVSSPENKFERIIVEIEELKKELEKLQLEKAKLIREIRAKIEKLDDCPEKTILFGFYIKGEEMEKISKELGYELSYCYRLKKRGVKML